VKIPAYQIQNVLRLYFRQMGEGKILEKSGRFVMSSNTPRSISSEGTRQAIIDKVAAGIVNKIISKASETVPMDLFSDRQVPQSAGKSIPAQDKPQFTYLLVDRHDKQTIHTAKGIQVQRDLFDMDD
jgi:hypothetical protein